MAQLGLSGRKTTKLTVIVSWRLPSRTLEVTLLTTQGN